MEVDNKITDRLLDHTPKKHREFFSEFLSTQLFSVYLTDYINNLVEEEEVRIALEIPLTDFRLLKDQN